MYKSISGMDTSPVIGEGSFCANLSTTAVYCGISPGVSSTTATRANIEHSVQELVSQRVYGLILGYEDLNGPDHLRHDPVHGLICGKRDPLGQDRVLERDKGKALAAHSTLNRLELSAQSIDWRYNKIQVQPDETEDLIIKRAVKAIPRKSAEIVLDFDATDDPLHGSQEGAFFNGYYRHYCYLPLYCFCGNIPLLAKLRDCKRVASDGTVEAL
jgi:hypothetical protein